MLKSCKNYYGCSSVFEWVGLHSTAAIVVSLNVKITTLSNYKNIKCLKLFPKPINTVNCNVGVQLNGSLYC